jgi:hypothetical protein
MLGIEALATHAHTPLTGMVFSQQAKTLRHAANPLVACPETLPNVAQSWTTFP